MLRHIEPLRDSWPDIVKRPEFKQEDLNALVGEILSEVAQRGDAALREYSQKFDQVELGELKVSPQEIEEASAQISEELKNAVAIASSNIQKFHQSQVDKIEIVETTKGVKCWRESRPIENVGLYIPGGTAPLFSSILMMAIPAKIAGCKRVVLCTPPSKDGSVNPAILYTAKSVGVTEVYKVGGAQAIAALAYGTESVPAVDKIFGPGNQYVTCAKQLVGQLGVSIDMPAGPSEVAVYADETSIAEFVASDLLSQAEHGVDSQVLLVATTEEIVEQVEQAVAKQLEDLPRKEIARQSLQNSKSVVLEDETVAFDFINEYAPEHFIIASERAESLIGKVLNAGSVFIGNYTPESVGDYASGTNHVLPTNKAARAFSGVSLDSFVKKITFQQLSEEGLLNLAPTVTEMASAELLEAHAQAVRLRAKPKE